VLAVFASGSIGWAQTHSSPVAAEQELAEKVYESVSQAVFVIESVGADGSVSMGTAFLAGDGKLITNAHVVGNGKPYLRVEAVRVPCTVDRRDDVNDLAALSVSGSVTARPLLVTASAPQVGATVFVVGTPVGLERSLSQGLIAGIRKENDRILLQITAPVSPGSSGGPVVNKSGEVVGVAAGYLRGGQNLNFAVPAAAITQILTTITQASSLPEIFKAIDRLREAELRSVNDPGPEWRSARERIAALLHQAINLARSSSDQLLAVAEGAKDAIEFEIQIEAARAAIKATATPNPKAHYLLAEGLYFARAETTEQRTAMLREAKSHAMKLVVASRTPTERDLSLVAEILEGLGEETAAYQYYQRTLSAARANGSNVIRFYLFDLFRVARDLGRHGDALGWFHELERSGEAGRRELVQFAQFLNARQMFSEAGAAWERAAAQPLRFIDQAGDPEYALLYQSGESYQAAERYDDALRTLRASLEQAALQERSEIIQAAAHTAIAAILEKRGVFEQSLVHARQATALDPTNADAFYCLARSLRSLERYSEAVPAAQNAIRHTDGAVAGMHFELGFVLFRLGNWNGARLASQKSAELDTKNFRAAFNTALCYEKTGSYAEAITWYEEALRRNPNNAGREQIQRGLDSLRAR